MLKVYVHLSARREARMIKTFRPNTNFFEKNGRLGTTAVTPTAQQMRIHDLFANWDDDGERDQEMDWGKPTGHELPW